MSINKEAVRAAMELRGVTPAKLAEEAGVSSSSVYKTLRGVRNNQAVIDTANKLLQPQLSKIEQIAAQAKTGKSAA
ncbi:MAG: helix-turn-helix domain-containing protein [Candidatus Cloacimonetes bacterium]|nr:helix-turn-helix domain-containing protein [Candidatus Cloacimonadota bacterium]